MACIFAELYSGELLFPTHENVEHLALMEKMSGSFPKWMIDQARDEFDNCFLDDEKAKQNGFRMNWP